MQFPEVEFGGKLYILTGASNDEGPLTTKEDYEAGTSSYAHLFPSGEIKRYCEIIGHKEDLRFTGKMIESQIGLHSIAGLMGDSWNRPRAITE